MRTKREKERTREEMKRRKRKKAKEAEKYTKDGMMDASVMCIHVWVCRHVYICEFGCLSLHVHMCTMCVSVCARCLAECLVCETVIEVTVSP